MKVYAYGSKVYGSSRPDSDSDWVVVNPSQIEPRIEFHHGADKPEGYPEGDVTSYAPEEFQRLLNENEISVLECYFQDPSGFTCQLDLRALRDSFSKKSSNSWVKARKKLAEGDIRIAQKSLYHSLRILMYGIQIAKHGKIQDWAEANSYLEKVESLPLNWEDWDSAFRADRKRLSSEFRVLAPK